MTALPHEEEARRWLAESGRAPHHFDGKEWNWVRAYASPLGEDPCYLPCALFTALPGHTEEKYPEFHTFRSEGQAMLAAVGAFVALRGRGWLPPRVPAEVRG